MSEPRVVNTSPLIFLSRVGLLELLRSEAEQVIVPQAVADEIAAWPTADSAQRAIHEVKWLTIAQAAEVPPSVLAWDLGPGESSVLAFGMSHPALTLILDDLAARRCAAAMGLPVRGTLGLVLMAKRHGAIPSARAAIRKLRDTGMYLSDAVADAALREIGE